jgi:hypothetical protein
MANVLPLMPFLNPGALADQATIENAMAQMPRLPPQFGPGPWGREVGPAAGAAVLPGFPSGVPTMPWQKTPMVPRVDVQASRPPYDGGTVVGGRRATLEPPTAGPNIPTQIPPTIGEPNFVPPAPALTQYSGLEQGSIPEQPQYPQVTPDEQVGSQGMPGYSYKPPQNYQPSASDFYPNGEGQQQQGGMSDAGMWGLLAAGLGILANNYGNYGNASPAVGKGGLIGLETFLGQRQQNTQNQLRRDTFNAELQGREEQRAINSRLAKVQEDKDKRAADADLRRQKALERFKPANDAEALLLELAPDEFAKLKLKQGENTKLGQGEGLYDANGKLIVKNPKDQDVPSGMRMGADGKLEWIPGYLEGKKQVAAAGASKITVGPQAKAFTGPIADQVDAAFTRTKDAVSTQHALNRLEENLDDPKLITGFGAKARLTAAQVAQLFGGDGADLAVTRSTIQGFAEIALQSRGMLKGQGQVTENEQKLLDRARSGDISFTLPELKELVSVLGRANKARYDDDAETIGRMEGMQDTEEAKKFYKPKEWPKKDLKKKYGLE